MRPLLRTTEHEPLAVPALSIAQRRAILEAAQAWQRAHRLPRPPLTFGGVDGTVLQAAQYVGIIEAGGVCVEIYPKLDRAVLQTGRVDDHAAPRVMRHLCWMMQAARHWQLVETGFAGLAEQPARFFDVLAWLLGVNLERELLGGVLHHYVARAEDVRALRGRIDFSRQLAHNWDRRDRLACRWEEFSLDTPLNRLLKCAVLFLARQTQHAEAAQHLRSCLLLLDEVAEVAPAEALAATRRQSWPRGSERYQGVYALARQILSGLSSETAAGAARSFTWLIDMNELFERLVAAAVADRFRVRIQENQCIGTLLRLPAGGIRQEPDVLWRDTAGALWIGDAKYKLLDGAAGWPEVKLQAHDVRQLTTYGGLAESPAGGERHLAMFYPCLGEWPHARQAETWNACHFHLVPVRLQGTGRAGDCLPPGWPVALH